MLSVRAMLNTYSETPLLDILYVIDRKHVNTLLEKHSNNVDNLASHFAPNFQSGQWLT